MTALIPKDQVNVFITYDNTDAGQDFGGLTSLQTIGDGNCMIHSILQCISPEYHQLSTTEKKKSARAVRDQVATLLRNNEVNHVFGSDSTNAERLANIFLSTTNGGPDGYGLAYFKHKNPRDSDERNTSRCHQRFIYTMEEQGFFNSVYKGEIIPMNERAYAELVKFIENTSDDYVDFVNGVNMEKYLSSQVMPNFDPWEDLSPELRVKFYDSFATLEKYDNRDVIGLNSSNLGSYYLTAYDGMYQYRSSKDKVFSKEEITKLFSASDSVFLEDPAFVFLALMLDVNILIVADFKNAGYLTLCPASSSDRSYVFIRLLNTGVHYESLCLKDGDKYHLSFEKDHPKVREFMELYDKSGQNIIFPICESMKMVDGLLRRQGLRMPENRRKYGVMENYNTHILLSAEVEEIREERRRQQERKTRETERRPREEPKRVETKPLSLCERLRIARRNVA